jgi:hypothetical protein
MCELVSRIDTLECVEDSTVVPIDTRSRAFLADCFGEAVKRATISFEDPLWVRAAALPVVGTLAAVNGQ